MVEVDAAVCGEPAALAALEINLRSTGKERRRALNYILQCEQGRSLLELLRFYISGARATTLKIIFLDVSKM